MREHKETLKSSEALIEEAMSNYRESFKELQKRAKYSGYATDIHILAHPHPNIGFCVNGKWKTLLNPSDTTKMLVKKAWSTTSKLRILVSWDENNLVDSLILTI